MNIIKTSFLLFLVIFSSCGQDKKTNVESNVTTTQEQAKEKGTPSESVKKDEAGTAQIEFEHKNFDFGEIKEGDVVKHIFKFKNSGSTPLIIKNASASCGCTVPTWTKDPIAPGQGGELEVQFNSAGKSGIQTKTVTVVANTNPAEILLEIKGSVNSPLETKKPEDKK